MADFLIKQPFTLIILTLYASNFLYQFFLIKDYAWGFYWMCAFGITIAAMSMSDRGG